MSTRPTSTRPADTRPDSERRTGTRPTTPRPAGTRPARRRRGVPNIPAAVGGWLWLAAIIIPIYYIAITSLKPRDDYYSTNPLLPSAPTFAP